MRRVTLLGLAVLVLQLSKSSGLYQVSCPAEIPCLRKCCGAGYGFKSLNDTTCISGGDTRNKPLGTHGIVVYGIPDCQRPVLVSVSHLQLPALEQEFNLYCVDKVLEDGSHIIRALQCDTQKDLYSVVAPVLTIPKCCPVGQGYNLASRACQDLSGTEEVTKPLLELYRNNHTFTDFSLGPPSCAKHEPLTDLELALSDVRFLGDESWMLSGSVLSRDQFCLDHTVLPSGVSQNSLSARVCGIRSCDLFPCVRKCCPEGEAMFGTECRPSSVGFQPQFYTHDLTNISMSLAHNGVFHGFPCSVADVTVLSRDDPDDEFYLTVSGKLYVSRINKMITINTYCIEHVINDDGDDDYDDYDDDLSALVCFAEAEKEDLSQSTSLVISSSNFLNAVLILYTLSWFSILHT